MSEKIVTLPGDGIGPEIMQPTLEVLNAVTDELEFDEHLIGGASIDEYGVPLTDQTLEACRNASAVLLGAVGGPKWDSLNDPEDPSPSPEQGLLGLRKGMGLFANIRPIKPFPAFYNASPIKKSRLKGTEFIIVRELTGGIYFGEKTRTKDKATDLCEYTRAEIEDVAHIAFFMAEESKKKVTSVDKANVLETSKLWREVVMEVGKEYDVPLEHLLVDNAVMQMISHPAELDIVLTENMFGDILSDAGATLTGSIGLLPSYSMNWLRPELYEPVHGSAPDIAGEGIANPMAMINAAALMLKRLSMGDEALKIKRALGKVIDKDKVYTRDLGGTATTKEVTQAILKHL